MEEDQRNMKESKEDSQSHRGSDFHQTPTEVSDTELNNSSNLLVLHNIEDIHTFPGLNNVKTCIHVLTFL